MLKKKYTDEQIEKLCKSEVFFFDYDAKEDCYVSKWTIKNYKLYGIYPQPEFETREQAEQYLKVHLKTNLS